jgi:hypothetical protein
MKLPADQVAEWKRPTALGVYKIERVWITYEWRGGDKWFKNFV